VTSFPKAKVIEALIEELIEVARSEAQVRGIALPPETSKVLRIAVPMDSLTVVDALCVLDSIVGFPLKDSIVRSGGYKSTEAALEHMIPRIERAWVRKKGPKP
jgi:hypothetical protein